MEESRYVFYTRGYQMVCARDYEPISGVPVAIYDKHKLTFIYRNEYRDAILKSFTEARIQDLEIAAKAQAKYPGREPYEDILKRELMNGLSSLIITVVVDGEEESIRGYELINKYFKGATL